MCRKTFAANVAVCFFVLTEVVPTLRGGRGVEGVKVFAAYFFFVGL